MADLKCVDVYLKPATIQKLAELHKTLRYEKGDMRVFIEKEGFNLEQYGEELKEALLMVLISCVPDIVN